MIIKPPETLNFVVIDPSLRSSGVLVCRDGKVSTYAIQRKTPRLQTLGWYLCHFAKLAKERQWNFIAIEEYAFSRQSSSVTVAAEIGGIIRACFSSYNIPILEMPIQTWKLITGIKMKKASVQDKRDYINAVIEKFGMECDTTDECDAFLMFYSIAMISRGTVKKGVGANIRSELERLKIRI